MPRFWCESKTEALQLFGRQIVRVGHVNGARLGIESVGEWFAQREDSTTRSTSRLKNHYVLSAFVDRQSPKRKIPRERW